MAAFLNWGIRVPALIAGAMFVLAGAVAILDWAAALTAAALCGFVVEAAGHFADKAGTSRPEPLTVKEHNDEEAMILQYRIAELDEDDEAA